MTYIPQFEPWLDEAELTQLSECIRDNWIAGGKKVVEFERRIAELCNVKRTAACVNGTVALFMSLKALGIGQGDEVIVPDFTFIASANSVVMANATPIFVDVYADTLNMDPEAFEDAITPKTKAVMPVHLYGQSANMDAVMKIAEQHCLSVIEDNAQGIGVTWNGKPAGSFGDVSILSFYADKTLTTGEGGMVLTNSDEIADKCLRLAHQGNLSKGQYVHETIGYNFRMTDLQAAIGLAQLDKLSRIIEMKRANEKLYRDLLNDVVKFPRIDGKCFNVPFRIVILVDDPEELSRHLSGEGIDTRRVFYPLHMQPCYNRSGDFPNSVRAYERGLALPSSARLTSEQIEYVCMKIRKYYEGS